MSVGLPRRGTGAVRSVMGVLLLIAFIVIPIITVAAEVGHVDADRHLPVGRLRGPSFKSALRSEPGGPWSVCSGP